MEYRQIAENLGIDDFRMSRALECHPKFIEALADAVENALPPYNGQNKDSYKIDSKSLIC